MQSTRVWNKTFLIEMNEAYFLFDIGIASMQRSGYGIVMVKLRFLKVPCSLLLTFKLTIASPKRIIQRTVLSILAYMKCCVTFQRII